ncbi:GntR family transcriptional regulator [Microlunatus sp. GCM10028923]|uniref:GntR family transcriptional regulator n=1 Tax=Microlunatus sp. GCM10028923 TaxID=3273400 RepID=UPI003612B262
MPSSHPESPYRVIAAEIRARIASGALRPGDRVPSIRAIAQQWGVAIATATKVTAVLREEGLVEAKVGSGTVVKSQVGRQPGRAPHRDSSAVRPAHSLDQELLRTRILGTAVDLADAEGLHTLSMRRLAATLELGPMSLYRQFTGKQELLIQMADHVLGELDLPVGGLPGWRAKLEFVAREQWRLCRRHLWLPQVVSFTRPALAPNMMAQTEWTLEALDGLNLPMGVRLQEALALPALVVALGLSKAEEAAAERTTGMTQSRWSETQRTHRRELLASGRFPLLATLSDDQPPDLDVLFEYGLARHLDGFAVMIGDQPKTSVAPA